MVTLKFGILKKIGIENKTSTEKGNIVIETFVLKTVVLALKQVLALKKETNSNN